MAFFYAQFLKLEDLSRNMRVTKADVEKLAALARLRLSDEEIEKYRGHLEQILTYVEKLNDLHTDEVEPTTFVQQTDEVMREDEVEPSLGKRDVMKNAPAPRRGFFGVPKVIHHKKR